MTVAFLAGKKAGIAIENPRQTPAYGYPLQYGPKSPVFARAMLVDGALWVSGTASIVGSQSVHVGNLAAQTDETVDNLRRVFEEAERHGFIMPLASRLCLVVYLRHAEDEARVRQRLAETFPSAHKILLQADICRVELLVEIEAFWF